MAAAILEEGNCCSVKHRLRRLRNISYLDLGTKLTHRCASKAGALDLGRNV